MSGSTGADGAGGATPDAGARVTFGFMGADGVALARGRVEGIGALDGGAGAIGGGAPDRVGATCADAGVSLDAAIGTERRSWGSRNLARRTTATTMRQMPATSSAALPGVDRVRVPATVVAWRVGSGGGEEFFSSTRGPGSGVSIPGATSLGPE